MTILVGMDYIEYAKNTMYGKNFCDLPEVIKDEIEEYFDGLNLLENSNANPNNMWVNSFTKTDKQGAIWLAYDVEVDEEEVEYYDDEELIEKLRDGYGFLGVVDGTYYLFQ